MTKQQLKDILDRVLAWSPEDQERIVRFVRQDEDGLSPDDISDEEWNLIEKRAAHRDVASVEEAKRLFDKYRDA